MTTPPETQPEPQPAADKPLIDNPHLPLTRGEFATAVVRLQTTLVQSVTAAIFERSLTPLDMRTEALMMLVAQLVTGKLAPGSLTDQELEAWFTQYGLEYEENLRARIAEMRKG